MLNRKNFFELYKVLEKHTDEETLSYLIYNYYQEVIDEAQKIKHNNTTRAAALKSYVSECNANGLKPDPDNGLYCEGHTAVNIPVKGAKYDDNNTIVKCFMDFLKGARCPVDFRDTIDYAIATAKCNGWRLGDTNFYIKINGAYYNLSLVARVYNCIADPKNNINGVRIEQDINENKPHYAKLLLSSKYGLGLVLPFNSECGAGLYDVTPGDDTLKKMIDRHEAHNNEQEVNAA